MLNDACTEINNKFIFPATERRSDLNLGISEMGAYDNDSIW